MPGGNGDGKPPEKTPHQLALEKAQKAVADMKRQFDKVATDLASVKLVEEKLRKKSWNAEGPLNYLAETSQDISSKQDCLLAEWLQASQENLKSKSQTELAEFAAECDRKAAILKDDWKVFAKEVLGEFSKMG